MILKIRNTTDLQEIYSSEVEDKGTSGEYYTFDISLPDGIPDGEYEYILLGGGEIISSGLLVIGDYASNDSQYNKEITYEQYETE